jgi:chorismate synthase
LHLRFTTAGESHGKGYVTIVEGLPAGLPVSAEWVDRDLARRMQGYGRGARMKIERDRIEWLAGMRAGETLGSPVAMRSTTDQITGRTSWPPRPPSRASCVAGGFPPRRRPAGLPGKTAGPMPVTVSRRRRPGDRRLRGAWPALLDEFERSSRVPHGGIRRAAIPAPVRSATRRPLRSGARFGGQPDIVHGSARPADDTLAGRSVVARGVVIGPSWLTAAAAHLAGLLMSIRRKGVEIGVGFGRPGAGQCTARSRRWRRGRRARGHAAGRRSAQPGRRGSNNAGGLEGGITTGEPVVARVAMKPISTLMAPLPTVDLVTGQSASAQSERSDVTAVPALGVIAEAMVALALAEAMLEKFGGDSLGEMRRNYRLRGGARQPMDRVPGGGLMPRPRHLLLVGLSGSGKSTVGHLVAEGLGATLFDIDQLLVRQMGMPVSQMFGMLGEPEFRRMERDAVAAAWAAEGPSVIVPGAGWAAQPGQMEEARAAPYHISPLRPASRAKRVEQGEGRRCSPEPTRLADPGPAQGAGTVLPAR